MINIDHLRKFVIRDTLQYLDPEIPYSLAAENVILATATHESGLIHLRQIGGGPARGLFQIEPDTEADNWHNFLAYNNAIKSKVESLAGVAELDLTGNLPYQVAHVRIKYWRDPEALPEADDIIGQAKLWKRVYNTPLGAGTIEQFLDHYPLDD